MKEMKARLHPAGSPSSDAHHVGGSSARRFVMPLAHEQGGGAGGEGGGGGAGQLDGGGSGDAESGSGNPHSVDMASGLGGGDSQEGCDCGWNSAALALDMPVEPP